MTLLFVVALISQSVFVSCDKEDDIFYAGESEADYKPATYTITSEWNFKNVSGMTSDQKNTLEKVLNESYNASEVFQSRADAVAAFDEVVIEIQHDPEMSQYKGLKAKFYLKREKAIIKSANLEW